MPAQGGQALLPRTTSSGSGSATRPSATCRAALGVHGGEQHRGVARVGLARRRERAPARNVAPGQLEPSGRDELGMRGEMLPVQAQGSGSAVHPDRVGVRVPGSRGARARPGRRTSRQRGRARGTGHLQPEHASPSLLSRHHGPSRPPAASRHARPSAASRCALRPTAAARASVACS